MEPPYNLGSCKQLFLALCNKLCLTSLWVLCKSVYTFIYSDQKQARNEKMTRGSPFPLLLPQRGDVHFQGV